MKKRKKNELFHKRRIAVKTNLLLTRYVNNGSATLGNLFIERLFQCYTLEDEPRDIKVAGKTRIPAGTYEIERCYNSGILTRMKSWFPEGDFIPSLKDVPDFDYVRIHTGNRHTETEGCLLVGTQAAGKDEYMVLDSRSAYKALWRRLNEAFELGTVWITIEDEKE